MKKIFFAAAFSILFTTFSKAQEMPSFSPEVKRVAVFKNGYAFTYREAETITKDGWAYTTKTPVGVLGTVWGYSTTPNIRVNQLLASESQKEEMERVENLMEFLLANEGAKIRVEVSSSEGKIKVYEGTYEVISKLRGFKNYPKPLANPDYYGSYESYLNTLFQSVSIGIKSENGTLAFAASKIENVEIIGQAKWSKPRLKSENRLAFKLEGAKDGQSLNLGVAALEPGLKWTPSYRVEVKGEPIKEAKLELEANIINDLTDLKNTDTFFVVGVPHFLFQDMASPLSINTVFRVVAGGMRREDRGQFSNAIASQSAARRSASDDSENEVISPTTDIEEKGTSFSAEQLYLYQANQLSLKKGERATMRLFSLTVPCSEVFEWTINDAADSNNRYMNPSGNTNQPLLQDLKEKIWYALRLKNTTGMPWTTAPAMSFREWKPLGQDMIKFTAIGGEEILKVTPATEIVGSHRLEEKSRLREKLRWSGYEYEFDLVTVEGTIKLKNVKKQPVEVVLTRNLVGEVSEASDAGKITKEGLNLQAINSNSFIKWNLNILPGEKEIKYSYKVYVRR